MTTRTETKTTALNSFLPRRGAPYDDPTGGQFLGGNPQRLTKWQRLQSTADPRGAAQTAYWYEVTRADDDEEPGSLRYGLQKLAKQGPLTILFANEVDRIELAGSLNIKHGDLTIDGSTSKGGVELTGFADQGQQFHRSPSRRPTGLPQERRHRRLAPRPQGPE